MNEIFEKIYGTCVEAKSKGINAEIRIDEHHPHSISIEENCGLKIVNVRHVAPDRIEYRLRNGEIGVIEKRYTDDNIETVMTDKKPGFDGYGVRYTFGYFISNWHLSKMLEKYTFAHIPIYLYSALISMHDPYEEFYNEFDRLTKIKKMINKHEVTIGDAKLIWSDTGTQEVAVYGDANVLDLVEKLIPFESFVVIIPSRTENAFMEIHKPGVRNQILSTTRSLVAEALKQLSISSLQEYKGSDLQKVIMSLNNNVMQYEYVLNEPTRRVLRLVFSKVTFVENGKYKDGYMQNMMYYYKTLAFVTGNNMNDASKIARTLRKQYDKDIPVVLINENDTDIAKALGMIDGEEVLRNGA